MRPQSVAEEEGSTVHGALLAPAVALAEWRAALVSVGLVSVAGWMPPERRVLVAALTAWPRRVLVVALTAWPRRVLVVALMAWLRRVLVAALTAWLQWVQGPAMQLMARQGQRRLPSTARRRCLPYWLVQVEGVQTP